MTTDNRAVPGVVITVPTPAVADGKPSLPAHWATFPADARLIQGPKHIHAIPDPDPVWNPATGGWAVPPPESGVGDYRWTVDSLPDPAHSPDGWYWLGDPHGDPSPQPTPVGGHVWAADAKTGGPSWHSFFPYRPSVSAADAHIPGQAPISHPRCIHCNSHYVEHMWLDFGKSVKQPFTWILVGGPSSDPYPGYQHHLLNAGRNPDDDGMPRLSASAVSVSRHLGDHLPYRTSLVATTSHAVMTTKSADQPLQLRLSAPFSPRMWVATFDGAHSRLAVFDPHGKRHVGGSVSTGTSYIHRYTVFGRDYGWISQRHASNLILFEIRFWHRALSLHDLNVQYEQLSTTYRFDQYRRL